MTDYKKPLITLACIVGNEEAVIERFIRSFAPAVDFMVFTLAPGDTPQDRSGEIIGQVCEELGVPFARSIYRNSLAMDHVDDFAAARQMAWDEAAKTKADYLIWADCDDLLPEDSAEKIRESAATGSHDVFVIPYHVRGDSQIVMRERMARNDGCSRWRYAIHEQLSFTRDVSYSVIHGAKFIHYPSERKTGSGERNITILKRCVEDAARNFFYLQMEYFERRDEKNCKKYGRAALAAPCLEVPMRYETLLNLAQCEDGPECKKLASEAFALMPDRREALALLVNYAIIDGDNEKALQLCRIMMGIPKPSKSYWSLNHDWYGWKGAQLFLQCLRLNGLSDEVLQVEKRLNNLAPTFSIIHATMGRPGKALAVREMWLSRAKNPNAVEYIFGIHEHDQESLKTLRGFKHNVTNKIGGASNYDEAAGLASGKVIIQAQDDCYPPEGWDERLLELIGNLEESVFVAVGDGQRTDQLCVNTVMTAEYMRRKARRAKDEGNGFFFPGYTTLFPDTENTYRAYKDAESGLCRLVEARDFVIYHDHPFFNPAVPWDSTYEFENCQENSKKDSALFVARNPGAVEGVLTFENSRKTS